MTIDEMIEYLPKEMLKIAVFNTLGNELTNELKNAGCELIIHNDLATYEFVNLTPELQTKIDSKKIK